MPVLTREAVESIRPEDYQEYQSLIAALKDTVLHYVESATEIEMKREAAKVDLFMDRHGNVDCYGEEPMWIRVHHIHDLDEVADENMPVDRKKKAMATPRFDRKPNLSTNECLHEYLKDLLTQEQRKDFVVQKILDKSPAKPQEGTVSLSDRGGKEAMSPGSGHAG
jgi:hypothetical protein